MLIKLLSLSAMALLATTAHDPLPDLKLGTPLPASGKKMKDVSGQDLSLKEIAGKNGLLVIFSCNTCPFVIGKGEDSEGWDGRYAGINDLAKELGVGFALVNSNETKRSEGDGMDDMKKRHAERKLGGRYLLDEGHAVADAFGARTTPHVFLFNKDLELVYKGAIDDNVKSASEVKEPWLRDAMANMVKGAAIDPALTRNIGCSVKRVPHHH